METFAKSLFWRSVAVLLVASLLLIGYAMLQGDSTGGFVRQARAADGLIGPSSIGSQELIITASPDGATIYEWARKYLIIRQSSGSCVRRDYVGR